jgi:hypothetical protein
LSAGAEPEFVSPVAFVNMALKLDILLPALGELALGLSEFNDELELWVVNCDYY